MKIWCHKLALYASIYSTHMCLLGGLFGVFHNRNFRRLAVCGREGKRGSCDTRECYTLTTEAILSTAVGALCHLNTPALHCTFFAMHCMFAALPGTKLQDIEQNPSLVPFGYLRIVKAKINDAYATKR